MLIFQKEEKKYELLFKWFSNSRRVWSKSVLGGLSSLLELMKIAANYGQTSVVTKDEEEVRLIFHNINKFEAMGYKVSFDYDDGLAERYEFDELLAEDMEAAKLDWSHKVYIRQ